MMFITFQNCLKALWVFRRGNTERNKKSELVERHIGDIVVKLMSNICKIVAFIIKNHCLKQWFFLLLII